MLGLACSPLEYPTHSVDTFQIPPLNAIDHQASKITGGQAIDIHLQQAEICRSMSCTQIRPTNHDVRFSSLSEITNGDPGHDLVCSYTRTAHHHPTT